MNNKDELLRRFLRYVAITSQSKASVEAVPSTKGQTELANLLAKDLEELGLTDISVDEHSIVYGTLHGNAEGPVVGFVSHLDTVDVSLNPDIHPQVIHYEGGDVLLNKER